MIHKLPLLLSFFSFIVFGWSQSWMTGQNPMDLNVQEVQKSIEQFKQENSSIKGNGIKPFERWLFENKGWIKEDGSIIRKPNRPDLYKAYLEENNKGSRADEGLPQWWPLGPFKWEANPITQANNPGLGRLNAVRVAPSDSNIIYVATAAGGLWKSEDGGKHWNTTSDDLLVLATSDIAIHPTNPDIVYCATGDRDGLDIYGNGVYKSIDGGATWEPTDYAKDNESLNYMINRMCFNPQNPNTLWFACPRGLYRTFDGGAEWEREFTFSSQAVGSYTNAQDVMYHPNDTNIIYGAGTHFIRSTDGGETFTQHSSGLPSQMARCEIAIPASEPDWIYLLGIDLSYKYLGVYRSVDKGETFTRMSDPSVNILGYDSEGNDDRSQGLYDLCIIADPNDPNHIITGGINLWESHNGGATMTNINAWRFNGQENYTHADIHWLDYDHETLYLGSDGGMFVSKDMGDTWTDLSAGLGITQVYDFEIDTTYDRLFFGTQDNGVFVYKNDTFHHIFEGDGFVCQPRRDDSNKFMVATQYGHLWRTTNNGLTFASRDPDIDGEWLTRYVRSKLNEDVLYGAFDEVYKSPDDGINWGVTRSMNDDSSFDTDRNFESFIVTGSDERTFYGSKGNNFYASTDEGRTWSIQSLGSHIENVYAEPGNPSNVWAVFSGSRTNKVHKSEDGGETWENMSDSLPDLDAYCIVFEKDRDGRLYLGMEYGVYYTDTTMDHWKSYNNQLPRVAVRDIDIDYKKNQVIAGTYGRGIYYAYLYGNVGVEEQVKSEIGIADMALYPNPTSHSSQLTVEFNERISGNIVLWGMDGTPIQTIPFNASRIDQQLSLEQLAPGVYFVSLITEKGTIHKRLMVQ